LQSASHFAVNITSSDLLISYFCSSSSISFLSQKIILQWQGFVQIQNFCTKIKCFSGEKDTNGAEKGFGEHFAMSFFLDIYGIYLNFLVLMNIGLTI